MGQAVRPGELNLATRSTDTTPAKLCSPATASTASGRELWGFIDAVHWRRAKAPTGFT
jgi:hypothetical protein